MKEMLVVLDPGHSSKTKGKQSPDGAIKEYKHNRILARFISIALRARDCQVKWTVIQDDEDLGLTQRANKANNYYSKFKNENKDGKALFLSIHSDASGDGSKWMRAEGFSVWTTKSQNNSDKAANSIWDAVAPTAQDWGMKMRKFSNTEKDFEEQFTVLFKAQFPAVLIECGFHDNQHDVELLKNDDFNNDLAEAIADGIINYFEKKR